MTKMTNEDLAWLAGLLEGEAGFGYFGGTQCVFLGMNDEDVVSKAASILSDILERNVNVGANDYNKSYKDGSKRAIRYTIQLYGRNARTIMRVIVSKMGRRRRQQIWMALNKYSAPKNGLKAADIVKLVMKK